MSHFRIAGIHGYQLSPLERVRLRSGAVSEIILFARNIRDRSQLKQLIRSIASYNVDVGIDHEGGRVHRFPENFSGITYGPAARTWMSGSRTSIAKNAARIAEELTALGFKHWYAPVADRYHPFVGTTVIGDRSASSDPERLADAVAAVIEGSSGYGLSRCLKHFPGHGHLSVDSHHGLPTSSRSLACWEKRDLPAFVAGVRAGAERVMAAHLRWPGAGIGRSWEDARFCRLLRKTLGSRVILLTDDLAMAAVGRSEPWQMENSLARVGFQGIMWCAPQATSSAPATRS